MTYRPSKFFILLATFLLLAGVSHADIVINEIHKDPAAVPDGDGEWFELYNTAMTVVDLEDWTVSNGSQSFTIDAAVIHGREFMVFARNDIDSENGGVEVDYTYGTQLDLADGAGELQISDSFGTQQDIVNYDDGGDFPEVTGATLALNDPLEDNNQGMNWFASTRAWPGSAGDRGTPGRANHYELDLANWSFEEWDDDGPTGWQHPDFGIATFAPTTDAIYQGDLAAEVTFDAFESGSKMVQTIADPVTDAFYDASLWVLDDVNNVQVALTIDLFDEAGELIGSFPGDESINYNQWQEITASAFVYAETDLLRLTIEFRPNFIFNPGIVYIDQAAVYTTVPIADLKDDPQPYLDRRVRTDGLVTQGTHTVQQDAANGFVQDDNAGIQIYRSDPLSVALTRGDSTEITGRVEELVQGTRIADFTSNLVNSDNPLPEPWRAPTGMFTTTPQQGGVWAELRGELLNSPGDPGMLYTLDLDDGSGVAEVVIHPDAGLDLSDAQPGDNLRMSGVMSLDQALVQLQPSLQEDIYVAPDAVELTITPTSGDVPEQGGPTVYDASLSNTTGQSFANVVAWRTILAPNGTVYGPFGVAAFAMPAGFSTSQQGLSQFVPAGAPAGTYVVYQNLGPNPDTALVWDQYSFVKLGADVRRGDGGDFVWTDDSVPSTTATGLAGSSESPAELPERAEIVTAYPNPFNAQTTVRVALPDAGTVQVVIYDITGRRVATLANGSHPAGWHSFSWDASGQASGVYFARLSGQGWNDTRKLVLMK